MVVLHDEVLELVFRISNGVVGTEGFLEFSDKVNPAVHPAWTLGQRSGVQEIRFEPFQGHALEVGLGEGYLCPILTKGFGAVLEAQFALDQEGPELFGIHAIKGVRFMDFGMGGQEVVGASRGAGETIDGKGEVMEDSQIRV